VLDIIGRSSSLVESLSTIVELHDDRIYTAAANGVGWGTWSALVATLSHFKEPKTVLELLGSERNVDLTEDQPNAL
jgi:hypothetical protein